MGFYGWSTAIRIAAENKGSPLTTEECAEISRQFPVWCDLCDGPMDDPLHADYHYYMTH